MWQALALSQEQLTAAGKRLVSSHDAFSAGGYGKEARPRRGDHQPQRAAGGSAVAVASAGPKGPAAAAPALMDADVSDSEDETAQETLKQVLNVTQRTGALEGCLLSAHLMDKECILNAHAVAAEQHYTTTVEQDPTAQIGPPSIMVAMAVLTFLLVQPVIRDAQDIRAEVVGLTGLVERIREETMELAAEYIKHWRAKSAYPKEGEDMSVRRTFYIHAPVPIGEPPNMVTVPANLLVSKCLMKLGSVPKPGPPPMGGPERKFQNSLQKLLKGGKTHQRW
ncbi:unnamed protein product [Prorocentrum cordatum]|uniref:Uncharacterized protein n=1 Tax=Prorocentrum cordatum TaxID=2364126 RepID=A0ABN9SD16_9DINO|nr:unnamed protein product [Polarella glacialis]